MIDCLSLARPFQVDEQGTYSGEFYTFALAGFIRQRGESDACRLVWYSNDAPTSTTIYHNIPQWCLMKEQALELKHVETNLVRAWGFEWFGVPWKSLEMSEALQAWIVSCTQLA